METSYLCEKEFANRNGKHKLYYPRLKVGTIYSCSALEELGYGKRHLNPIVKKGDFVFSGEKGISREELLEKIDIIKEEREKVNNPTGLLSIENYLENIKEFSKIQPLFYDSSGLFWFWDLKNKKWDLVDEVDILRTIDNELKFNGRTIESKIRTSYLNAFKHVGRESIPKQMPETWIQFKDKIIDIETKEIKESTPEFFMTNPIPYEIGKSNKTPVMDKLFEEWVGKENVILLKEIIAYCCLCIYPIQVLICLFGNGRNGKSQFLKILRKFLGNYNLCSTELDVLGKSRFESAKLYKKLACFVGETNFGTLNNTSMIKKLTGGDLIGFEFKNKTPFEDVNYATIVICTNSLPYSQDTSDGFFRRWVIMDFPNQFPEGNDIVSTIPEEEYNNLAKKVIDIIPGLLKRGSFTNQGTIEERKNKYILSSNPLSFFLEHGCERDYEMNKDYFEKTTTLYIAYTKFLSKIKRRLVKRKEFNNALTDEGLENSKTSITNPLTHEYYNGFAIKGVKLKENYLENSVNAFKKIGRNTDL